LVLTPTGVIIIIIIIIAAPLCLMVRLGLLQAVLLFSSSPSFWPVRVMGGAARKWC
jgi:hypothetical protein